MPGTFAIDSRNTFANMVYLSCSPRTKFGSEQIDVLEDGRTKWAIDVAATFHSDPGKKPISEVLSVTVAAQHDPAAAITPGSVVELDGLKLGISAPERNDKGGIRGGKPWYQASGVRPLNGSRPVKTDG